jgi:hypothetical protein
MPDRRRSASPVADRRADPKAADVAKANGTKAVDRMTR